MVKGIDLTLALSLAPSHLDCSILYKRSSSEYLVLASLFCSLLHFLHLLSLPSLILLTDLEESNSEGSKYSPQI